MWKITSTNSDETNATKYAIARSLQARSLPQQLGYLQGRNAAGAMLATIDYLAKYNIGTGIRQGLQN